MYSTRMLSNGHFTIASLVRHGISVNSGTINYFNLVVFTNLYNGITKTINTSF